jgi:hypothetical protein
MRDIYMRGRWYEGDMYAAKRQSTDSTSWRDYKDNVFHAPLLLPLPIATTLALLLR